MTSLTLISSTTAVTLDIVETVTQTVSKNVTCYTFGDGTESMLDEGKTQHGIIVSGVNYTSYIYSPYMDMNMINEMMDNMEEIAVIGFEDTNFNTDYIITDFGFNMQAGEGCIPLYHYNITLERLNEVV